MAVIMCGGREAGCDLGRECAAPVETFSGAVLALSERNGYHDSDFVATVWDAERGEVRDVSYASTASWTYHNGAKVDATKQAREAALGWYRRWWAERAVADAQRNATTPEIGKIVRSLTTRGKNCGVVGRVGWIGEGRYRTKRVGIDVEHETARRFLPMDRVEVVAAADVDETEIGRHAAALGEPEWSQVLRK